MDSSHQHRRAMALPHRRPAYGVNAPALFRHLGFRIVVAADNPLTATDIMDAAKRRRAFVQKLNASLASLQQRCATAITLLFAIDTADASDTVIPTTNTLLNVLERLPADLAAWRARLRVDIHSEYYFVTIILDQRSGHECDPKIDNYERTLTETGCAALNTAALIQEYYETVWNALDEHLANALADFPGEQFTEFRSIALRDRNSPFLKNRDKNPETYTIPQIDASDFGGARKSMRDWLGRNVRCVHEILQFQEFTQKIDQDANCVLCEMLDGSAVYGSSVRQVPLPTDARGHGPAGMQPLRYFLLYNGLSKYQLGRLIRRTHVMGELRVAAVLDADLLDQASMEIRALGNKIDEFLKEPEEEVTLSDSEIDAVLQRLNKISALVPGGLMYRINRSRYYVQAFRERMSDMRVKRLEGWQPYDEFFQRNLYQVFDEIDQIGKRYEALAERINRLIVARNADRLRRSQENIKDLVSEMATADRTIARIQKLGELVGLVAVTYYGGHVIAEGLHALCGGEHHITGFVSAFVGAFTVGVLWHRSHKKEDEGLATAPETAPRSAR